MSSEGGDLKWWPLLDKVRESCALNKERCCWRLQVAPAYPSSRGFAGPRRAPQAPQLCSPKGKHFFQCRSVDHPTFREWLALPWSPVPLSGSPGLLELARKAAFHFKGDFLSHHGLPCPAPPAPGGTCPRSTCPGQPAVPLPPS